MLTAHKLLATALIAAPVFLAAAEDTTCDPLTQGGCAPDPALSSSSYSVDWTKSTSLDNWLTTAGSLDFGSDGAEFVINHQGDAPTIQTEFYIFFGKVEVTMQAAAGTGIVSSIVLLSDVLDEIDWEFTGGNAGQTQTNYFGKGNTTTYDRAIWYNVNSPQTTSHTYTVDWTSEAITWYIDGTAVRTLNYADANGGSNFPQTPCRLRLGIWAGGDPSNGQGTIEWAGGLTDFSQAPFKMFVESVKITNYSPGSQYRYKDSSGSFNSIQVVNGVSGGISGGSTGGSGGSGSSQPAATSSTPTPTKPVTTKPAGITRVPSSSPSIPANIKSTPVTSGPSAIPLTSAIPSITPSTRKSRTRSTTTTTTTTTTPTPTSTSTSTSTSIRSSTSTSTSRSTHSTTSHSRTTMHTTSRTRSTPASITSTRPSTTGPLVGAASPSSTHNDGAPNSASRSHRGPIEVLLFAMMAALLL